MRLTPGALFLLAMAALAAADEVELTNGDIISDCKVTDLGDSYRVVKGAISRTIAKTDVKRVDYRETREDMYRKRAAALKDDDLDGHLKLARWCRDIGLASIAADEFKKVIALNPDHEEARTALGYQKVQGQWMTEEEVNRAKGLVKHKGKWMTPEERNLDIALDEQRELERKIGIEVRKWIDNVATNDDKKRQEAIDNLAKFEDKYKVKPYLSAITRSHRQLRLFVAQELGRINADLGDSAWTAARTLARRVVWDDSEDVRAAARKSLVAINHPDTVTALTPFLDEDSSTIRIRTEDVIGYFKDLRAFPPLLGALARTVDSLKFIEQYEKQIAQMLRNTLVTKDGRRVQIPPDLVSRLGEEAFSREGKKRLEDERESVLSSLRAITGKDFGSDVGQWRAWYEKTKPEKK